MAVSRTRSACSLVQLVAADQAVGGAIPGVTVVIVTEQTVQISPSRNAPPASVMLSMPRVSKMAIRRMAESGGTRSAARRPILPQPQLIQPAAGDGLDPSAPAVSAM